MGNYCCCCLFFLTCLRSFHFAGLLLKACRVCWFALGFWWDAMMSSTIRLSKKSPPSGHFCHLFFFILPKVPKNSHTNRSTTELWFAPTAKGEPQFLAVSRLCPKGIMTQKGSFSQEQTHATWNHVGVMAKPTNFFMFASIFQLEWMNSTYSIQAVAPVRFASENLLIVERYRAWIRMCVFVWVCVCLCLFVSNELWVGLGTMLHVGSHRDHAPASLLSGAAAS